MVINIWAISFTDHDEIKIHSDKNSIFQFQLTAPTEEKWGAEK